MLALADSRKEERDEGRRGVVGREVLDREVERFRADSGAGTSAAEDIVRSRRLL